MTTPTLVQHTSTQGSAVTSLSVTLPSVAAGNMVWAGISFGAGADVGYLTSLADSNGTLTEIIIGPGTSNGENGQWAEYGAAAGTHAITATWSSGANAGLFAAEFSGVASSAALDGTPEQNNSSGTPITCPTVTPSQTGDLWIAMVASGPGGVTYTSWLNGLTPVDLQNGSNSSGTWAYTVWNSTGAAEAGCTPSITNPWSISSALFKAAASSGATGSAAITEGTDSVSATGGIAIAGAAAITEGADTVAATGTLSVSGSASITESADTVAATGAAGNVGSASITEGADTAAATGTLSVSGAASITEGADTVAASGSLGVAGTAAITEAADTVSATGSAASANSGSAAITEGPDTASATGSLSVSGSASIVEGGDIVVASGSLKVSGAASITEGSDTVAASGYAGQVVKGASVLLPIAVNQSTLSIAARMSTLSVTVNQSTLQVIQ